MDEPGLQQQEGGKTHVVASLGSPAKIYKIIKSMTTLNNIIDSENKSTSIFIGRKIIE